MAEFNLNQNLKQTVNQAVSQRALLLGRVKMAQAIHMPESEWAKALTEVESDPLFQELLSAKTGAQRVISYKRYGRTQLSGQFYEMQDSNVVGGSGESPETLLNRKKHLLKLIEKIGQNNFEHYFLYREDGLALKDVADICCISLPETQELQDFVMEMSVQAEFYHPSGLQAHEMIKPTMVGTIIKNDDASYSISYFSPHLARGLYEINQLALRKWQKDKKLDRAQAAKLRRYVGLLELSNLKQGAFWRVVEYLLKAQKPYFDTQDESRLAPLSLRHIARDLGFAPSTISRVISSKSVKLPWDHEVLIAFLMPGQRRVVLSILDRFLTADASRLTDAEYAKKIFEVYGVKMSRRTITACRHSLGERKKAA